MDAYLPALETACRSDRWALVKIDVDRAENAPAVERFGVRAVPTLSLLDERGAEVLHLVGYQGEVELREALERRGRIQCASLDVPGPSDGFAEPVCAVYEMC